MKSKKHNPYRKYLPFVIITLLIVAVAAVTPKRQQENYQLHNGLADYWKFLKTDKSATPDARVKNFRKQVITPNLEAYNAVAFRWFRDDNNIGDFLKRLDG